MLPALPMPIVALVTDRKIFHNTERLVEAVDEAVTNGVNVVQLREKDMWQIPLLDLARELREVTKDRALLFVNGDLDVALLARADGVHLSEADARGTRRAAAQGLVGRSVHDGPGARRAERDGAHFLFAGPIFETKTHPGQPPAGPALIREVAEAAKVPIVGIGGITADNANEVMAAGASGVAVIREILAAPAPGEAAQRLRRAVEEAWETRQVPVSKEGT